MSVLDQAAPHHVVSFFVCVLYCGVVQRKGSQIKRLTVYKITHTHNILNSDDDDERILSVAAFVFDCFYFVVGLNNQQQTLHHLSLSPRFLTIDFRESRPRSVYLCFFFI